LNPFPEFLSSILISDCELRIYRKGAKDAKDNPRRFTLINCDWLGLKSIVRIIKNHNPSAAICVEFPAASTC